ncbi:MAG: Uma2 family endonuclease [Acidobacteriota bacterium]
MRIATQMSVDEWAALDEDEPGELVDGELQEEEMAGVAHEVIVGFLIEMFRRWIVSRGGVVGGSEIKFVVAPRTGRKPDVAVFFPGQLPPPDGPVRTPPDIMVEVVTPTARDSRRDRVSKPDDYARFGVRFYWIVDPGLRSVEIFELLADGRYARAVAVTEGLIAAVPGCEGLSVDVDALWAEIDRLGPPEPAE